MCTKKKKKKQKKKNAALNFISGGCEIEGCQFKYSFEQQVFVLDFLPDALPLMALALFIIRYVALKFQFPSLLRP